MVSRPTYGVSIHLDVRVEMRDGVELSTDIYRPTDPNTGEAIDDPRPALFVRTPYDKRGRHQLEQQGRWYAKRGYIVAIQDVRGRYESDGEFYLLQNEAEDGYDAIEWLGNRPYCDGQVGTMGTSYLAWVQSALATQDPPSLSAMFVNQGAANAWKATLRHNGAFEMRWLTWALTVGGGFAKGALNDTDVQRRLADVDTRDVLENEPVKPGQSPLRHLPNYEEWTFDFASTGGEDEFWDSPSINFERHYDQMADVPAVYAGSWYDSYAKATCDNFEALKDRMESDQYLIMGAWTHGGQNTWTRTFSGEIDLGEKMPTDYLETKLRFFDHYLKGEDTWSEQSPVTYFQMGTDSRAQSTRGRLTHGGEWRSGDGWPLPDTDFEKYYIHEDGTLSKNPPAVANSQTSYEFDPEDPVPTLGGNCSSYLSFEPREESLEELPLGDRPYLSLTGHGGYDQRTREDTFGASPPYGPVEQRDDVLVYRTPPLEETVEIAGPITIRIFASTDARDTDFTAKLIDEYPASSEYPNGFALNLSDSICRARYRGYRRSPDFVEPGEVYEFQMEPYPTANRFETGHRIRLDISSSNYPRYDVNHNTGGPLYGGREHQVATNTVYHEKSHSTHVELPVRPTET